MYLFIKNVITTGNITDAPVIGFIFLLLTLFIPTLIVNIIFFKNHWRKQRIIESNIKKNVA